MQDYKFGNYLLSLRLARGISQKKLAKILHCSDKAISKWETGRAKPKNEHLLALAAFFGISLDALLLQKESAPIEKPDDTHPLSVFLQNSPRQTAETMRNTPMNLIPETSVPCYDYLCTWSMQERVAKQHGITGEGCANQRDALTDALLFGSDHAYHPYDVPYRKGLYFVIDDGWDVPFGTKHLAGEPNVYGKCDPDPKKFPHYGDTPLKRLTTLCKKVEALGYAGLGLWIAPQVSGETSQDPASFEEATAYWYKRAKWCAEAGVKYWKVDWGSHCLSADYRRMMTEAVKAADPDFLIEHAYPQPPFTQMGKVEKRIQGSKAFLPLSDVFRLYDVANPFLSSSMLMRIDEAMDAAQTIQPESGTVGILNAEVCAEICAAFGCALGIMGNGTEDTSDLACLRWHRIAPPFSVYESDYKKSTNRLTDTCFFSRDPAWWIHVKGKTLAESAPAVMARGCELPTIETDGLAPFVCASKHPRTHAYSIATLRRTVSPNQNFIAPAHVSFQVGNATDPVGIFGYYAQLSLHYAEPIAAKRVFAQDMMDTCAYDVTDLCKLDGNTLTIDGETLQLLGTRSRSDKDSSDPSLILLLADTESDLHIGL